MKNTGFYSVVQFCPDLVRREVVNVGVILGSPSLGIRAHMAERNEYVKQMFGAASYDDARLSFAKDSLVERLKQVDPTIQSLATFISQESGQLVLTPPLPMVVKNLVDDTLGLFMRVVMDPEVRRREARHPKPDLRRVVRSLERKNVPIQRNPEVSVPIIDEPLKADFSFQNGVRNLVKSVGISGREETALDEVSHLGSKGLLLAKHPGVAGANRLVLVADIDDQQLRVRIERLLEDHQVRFVDAQQLPDFALEIERDAH